MKAAPKVIRGVAVMVTNLCGLLSWIYATEYDIKAWFQMVFNPLQMIVNLHSF